MIRTRISEKWHLKIGNKGEWKPIDLPNDYIITQPRDPKSPGGASNGFFTDGTGTYAKTLIFDKTPKHYILDIDGAYMCADVALNNYKLIMHPHGYTPLLVDLTKRAKFGAENKLEIITNSFQPSSRWYSGGGIYRDIFLWTGGDVRIEPRDVFVTTPDTQGTVQVSCKVSADRDANPTVSAIIVDSNGNTVGNSEAKLSVKADNKTLATLTLNVENPTLWDTENPYLYKLIIKLTENGEELDISDTTFGIRTISVDAEHGLLLNGKSFKLRGGCIHHDHGVLGAADYPAACRRKLERLKAAGFNALRIAHNPPSLQLLEQCDQMGIIVMDEAFDCWRIPHGGMLGYHLWFDDWWARDIANMVLRDRNHPCVISYSIGNEIPESCGNCDGDEWSKRLSDEIRKYDNSRIVTSATYQMGDAETWADRTEGYYAPLDACGYNYLYTRYEADHKRFPKRVIWGSETHALHFFDSWKMVMENNYLIGDFTWTAYDNIGEVGTGRSCWARDGKINGISLATYPWRTCYQGDLDLCGYRRPQSFYREAIFRSYDGVYTQPRIFTTHPEHYGEEYSGTGWHWYDVLDTWTFSDKYLGKPVKCEVYSCADEIEWFLNGKPLGKSKPEKAIATFDIPYEKGEISVIAYKNGVECGRSSLHTVGQSVAIKVEAETKSFKADNRDLCYFDISVVDDNGDRIPNADNELTCLVNGGKLLGIFSGNPKNEDKYGTNSCHAFEGRAVAIVCAEVPGKLELIVGSDGLNCGKDEVVKK